MIIKCHHIHCPILNNCLFSILPICIYIFLYFILFRSIVLDYDIAINNLRQEDQIFIGGSLGNYSLAGFEMILRRHVSHYIINYYLPSGLFVVVSWISFLVPADIIPGRVLSRKKFDSHILYYHISEQ